ncbi:MAG: molybdopterin-guanine dinucleotide biosynthesis protein B [Thermoplasmata archaeon]|nr:MAG: molybdopterin-guanine dinucleotide biosynthesis protein B [Thermoplasmata archaeon]RLF36432.1 MAG: molybdopterin-guanine dinucleotide biosynthesis protein B [Thermoplasmata archaeon]
MEKPFIIGFYGESNTGKTTIITKLIKKLTQENFNIASIKNTDKKISIDQEGKDTWKHAKAGAEIVVFKTPIETDYIVKKQQNLREIIDKIKQFGNYDLVIIEGVNDETTPKIRIGNIKKRKNTVYTYENDFKKLYNFIKEKIK